jgi:spermidine/putrescine transport system substrate-binding protein
MLQQASSNWASFDSEAAQDLLTSGQVDVGMSFHGDAAQAREQKGTLQYAFPAQGYIVWMDSIVLLKDAPNRENALTFMDFMLEPENIAAVTNFARYSAGVKGVEEHLDPELATMPEANPVPGSGVGVFVEACDPETQALYDQIWADLKAAFASS